MRRNSRGFLLTFLLAWGRGKTRLFLEGCTKSPDLFLAVLPPFFLLLSNGKRLVFSFFFSQKGHEATDGCSPFLFLFLGGGCFFSPRLVGI